MLSSSVLPVCVYFVYLSIYSFKKGGLKSATSLKVVYSFSFPYLPGLFETNLPPWIQSLWHPGPDVGKKMIRLATNYLLNHMGPPYLENM